MVVEKGFKETEVGVIPEDWEINSLDYSANLKARIGWQGLTTNEYLETGAYCLVTGTDFQNGYINWDTCVFVESIRYHQDKNIQLRDGDVLVTKDGTIGKVAYINFLPYPTTLNSGVFVVRPKFDNLNSLFFYYILMSFYFDYFLKKITAGSTITHLYQKDFVHFKFPIPPKKEQTAIATALSDMDALIAKTEQLIEKKKAIKQGVMQELLTGRTRLPGFENKKGYKQTEVGLIPEDWEVSSIENCVETNGLIRGPFGGALKKEFFITKGYKVYEQKNAIYKSLELGDYFIDKLKFIELSRFQIKDGDFIVSCSGTIGRILLIPKNHEPGVINQALLIIRIDKNKCNKKYFEYYFSSDWFQNKITDSTQGGAMKNMVGMKEFKMSSFLIPPLPEQTAIAEALSAMDENLTLLDAKLQKLKLQKQGMMQALLTGKIRLI